MRNYKMMEESGRCGLYTIMYDEHKTRRQGFFSQEFSFQKTNVVLQLPILIFVSCSTKGTNKFLKIVDNPVAPVAVLVVEAINALFFQKDTLHDSSLQRDGNSALLNSSQRIPSLSFKGSTSSASCNIDFAYGFQRRSHSFGF